LIFSVDMSLKRSNKNKEHNLDSFSFVEIKIDGDVAFTDSMALPLHIRQGAGN